MPRLPLGKLPGDLLQAILDKHTPRDPRVVVGPRVGEDAAVIEAGDRYLVVTSDPITFATDELGWYALHVNANDVVVRGATPRWFLATLLLPAGSTDEASVRAVFAQLASLLAPCLVVSGDKHLRRPGIGALAVDQQRAGAKGGGATDDGADVAGVLHPFQKNGWAGALHVRERNLGGDRRHASSQGISGRSLTSSRFDRWRRASLPYLHTQVFVQSGQSNLAPA